jgi:hypothetical protein
MRESLLIVPSWPSYSRPGPSYPNPGSLLSVGWPNRRLALHAKSWGPRGLVSPWDSFKRCPPCGPPCWAAPYRPMSGTRRVIPTTPSSVCPWWCASRRQHFILMGPWGVHYVILEGRNKRLLSPNKKMKSIVKKLEEWGKIELEIQEWLVHKFLYLYVSSLMPPKIIHGRILS